MFVSNGAIKTILPTHSVDDIDISIIAIGGVIGIAVGSWFRMRDPRQAPSGATLRHKRIIRERGDRRVKLCDRDAGIDLEIWFDVLNGS